MRSGTVSSMRVSRRRPFSGRSLVLTIAAGLWLPTAFVMAEPPRLGLGASEQNVGELYVDRGTDHAVESTPAHPTHGWHPYYNHYGYYPWYAIPRTYRYKRYPENTRTARTPDLQLRPYDPYAWVHGLRLPKDAAPLPPPPDWRGYEGVVGAAKREAGENASLVGDGRAIELMKKAKYKQAGRLLAAAFRRDDHPRYPLLLSEVFLGLGKTEHAELLLGVALESEDVAAVLPRKIAEHFPPNEFERIASEVTSKSGDTLLAAYLLVHSQAPEKGLDALKKLYEAGDVKAGVLYRHYLGQVFRD